MLFVRQLSLLLLVALLAPDIVRLERVTRAPAGPPRLGNSVASKVAIIGYYCSGPQALATLQPLCVEAIESVRRYAWARFGHTCSSRLVARRERACSLYGVLRGANMLDIIDSPPAGITTRAISMFIRVMLWPRYLLYTFQS